MKPIIFCFIIFTTAYSQTWVAVYNGPGNWRDRADDLAIDRDCNVYITGLSYGVNINFDFCTIKYNSSGIEQWLMRYNSLFNGNDLAEAIAIDSQSNVYVTGTSETLGQWVHTDIVTIKYNSAGTLQWVRKYGGPSDDHASDICADGDGNVYVTGFRGPSDNKRALTIKYNSEGNLEWAVIDSGVIGSWTFSIGLDSFGNVYTGGYQALVDRCHYLIIKFSPDGTPLWRVGFNLLPHSSYIFKLGVTPGGDVYGTGQSGPMYQWDIVTIKVNTSGEVQWVERYNGPAGNGWDRGQSLTLDKDGNVYVTGPSANQPGNAPYFDWATIKYSCSGIEQWVRRYDGYGGDDWAFDIKVDQQKNVYVAGFSMGPLPPPSLWTDDPTIVKYDSLGNEIWVARYRSPNHQAGWISALALDREDNIYGTGFLADSLTDFDYFTIKYLPSGPGILEAPRSITQSLLLKLGPNPFSNALRIELASSEMHTPFNLLIYDISGRVVRSFHKITNPSLIWDGRDDLQKILPSGIYFIHFEGQNHSVIKKVIKQK